ncbi:MAG: efflux RND transporter periplasmic adaptor subunit, partial [Gemmatimonadaceae bacterium]
VHVVAGQRVAKGEVLVELDQVAFRGAVNATKAALEAAEAQYARQQRLAEAGVAARREVEQAATELATARAAAASARRQAEWSVMRSPIAGAVTSVTAVLGAMADPAQTLVQVADGRVLDLVLSVPPHDAMRLRPGAEVDVLGEGKETPVIGHAVLTAVGGAVDSATRAVTVRAALRESTRPLEIGATVPVRVVIGVQPKALVVPVAALVPDGESFRVFVVDAAGITHARAVDVVVRTETLAAIGKGLRAGERVVAYGAYGMDEGVRVQPAAAGAPAATLKPDAK